MTDVTTISMGEPQIPRISLDDLKKLIDDKTDVIILDARPKDAYDNGHIKGALSFPWKAEVTGADVDNLAKNKLIVTYCDCGPGEADASGLTTQLAGLGFANLKVLADPAIRGWKNAGYSME